MHELLIHRRWATRIAEVLTISLTLRQTFKFHHSNFTVRTKCPSLSYCHAFHFHSEIFRPSPLQIRDTDRCSWVGKTHQVLDFLALVRLTLSGKRGESSEWLKIFSSF